MRSAVVLLVLGCGIAAADPPARPAADKPVATCKKVVVGKGLERHVTCEISAPIVVGTTAPKPGVIIMHADGRKVVGRPQSPDRFAGLSHQLR